MTFFLCISPYREKREKKPEKDQAAGGREALRFRVFGGRGVDVERSAEFFSVASSESRPEAPLGVIALGRQARDSGV